MNDGTNLIQPTYAPGYLVTGGSLDMLIEYTKHAIGHDKIGGTVIDIAYGNQSNFLSEGGRILQRFAVEKIIGIDPSSPDCHSDDGRIQTYQAFGYEFLSLHPEIRGNFVIGSYDVHIEPIKAYQMALANLMVERCNDWICVNMCNMLAKIFLADDRMECVLNELMGSGSGSAIFVKKKTSSANLPLIARTGVSEILDGQS